MSRKCKIDPGTVSGYLSGKRRPRPDVLQRIATAFGISLEDLIADVDPETLGNDDTLCHDAMFVSARNRRNGEGSPGLRDCDGNQHLVGRLCSVRAGRVNGELIFLAPGIVSR